MVKQIIPANYREALSLLNEEPYQIIAGGTDLMIQKRNTAGLPPKFEKNLLFLFNLKELKVVIKEPSQIRIGSMTSLEDLLDHPDTPPLLKQVIAEMASPAVRNVATLSGNIGNASPAGDSLVALYLLDAMVVLESIGGIRRLPIEEIIVGPRKTVIRANELIREIIIPDQDFTKVQWIKVGGRRADAISKVSFAGAVSLKNQMIQDFRVALGAVYQTVIRNRSIEASIKGQTVSALKAEAETILAQYEPLIRPIDDQRSNKDYRKQVALNMIKDFLMKI